MLEKTKVEILDYRDQWQEVKDRAMNTIGKKTGKYPTSEWKERIVKAEHSPIRVNEFTVQITNAPYFVVMHLVRHYLGVTPFVSTQRTDRTGIDRTKLPQDNEIMYTFKLNTQAFINISRKRLCMCASPETRQLWQMVVDELAKYEPEIASNCVRECVYRGFCPEMYSCGYDETDAFKKDLEEYRRKIIEHRKRLKQNKKSV